MQRPKIIEGEKFGRWTVLEGADDVLYTHRGRVRRLRHFRCRCECGNVRRVSHRNLVEGKSKSCGCLRTELSTERIDEYNAHRRWVSGQQIDSKKFFQHSCGTRQENVSAS
jgi:hypothetical protein